MKKKFNLVAFGRKPSGNCSVEGQEETSQTPKVTEKGKTTKDKDFVRFKCYYPECDIIELKAGEYLKLFEIQDSMKESTPENYINWVKKLIDLPDEMQCQFLIHKGRSYLVLRGKAELVDDMIVAFESVKRELDLNELFSFLEVCMTDWFSIITELTQFKGYEGEIGVTKRNIKQAIQPIGRKVKPEYLEIGEMISRTAILTNFPSEMFTGFMTELVGISDRITTSIYIEEINGEHCLKAMDTVTDMPETKRQVLLQHLTNKQLYNCCALLHIDGLVGEVQRIFERAEELCRNYLVSINPLEQQQVHGFLSVLPLCDNHIRCNKALNIGNVCSLLDFSWMKRLHSGYCYGISEISGKELYFNRLMERESGFYLGGKSKEKLRYEINWVQKKEHVAVFTLGTASTKSGVFHGLSGNKILCDNPALNREIIRAIAYIRCGTNGNVSDRVKAILNKALEADENVMDYNIFLQVLVGISADLAKKMSEDVVMTAMQGTEELSQTGSFGVYKPQGSTQTGQFIELMGGLAHCKEDVIYILDGDTFAGISDNRFIIELMRISGKMITCMSNDDMTLLRNPVFKEAIRESGFLCISECDTLEKINLAAVLKLDKRQTGHIAGVGHSLLVTKYADYLL